MTELSRDVIHYLITSYFCTREDHREYHDKNGVKRYTYRGKWDGLYQSWWTDGQLQASCNYINGERHGLYESWHDNGQLWESCNYVDGKLDGLYQSWYRSSGVLGRSCNYVNGVKIE